LSQAGVLAALNTLAAAVRAVLWAEAPLFLLQLIQSRLGLARLARHPARVAPVVTPLYFLKLLLVVATVLGQQPMAVPAAPAVAAAITTTAALVLLGKVTLGAVRLVFQIATHTQGKAAVAQAERVVLLLLLAKLVLEA